MAGAVLLGGRSAPDFSRRTFHGRIRARPRGRALGLGGLLGGIFLCGYLVVIRVSQKNFAADGDEILATPLFVVKTRGYETGEIVFTGFRA